MEIFDTHFHYYGESTPAEFRRMISAELAVPPQSDWGAVDRVYLLAVGGDYLESCRAREFAQAVPDAWFAAGVHPHQAETFRNEGGDFSSFRGHPRLVAVGELGLDYYYEESPREVQKSVLAEFLALALEWNLPVIIHIRDRDGAEDAYVDVYDLLRDFAASGGRFVVHCFAGSPAWAEKFLALGGYCGVTGMVTFNRAENNRETLRVIPDDRLLIETDSPYLAPVPHRGSPNHPGYLILVAARIAAERGWTVEETARLTTRNGFAFFRPAEEVRL